MQVTKNWWEDVFEGHLALGINEEKLCELENEHFLFFEEIGKEEEMLHQ